MMTMPRGGLQKKVDVCNEQMNNGATLWKQDDVILTASAFYPRFIGINSDCLCAMHWDLVSDDEALKMEQRQEKRKVCPGSHDALCLNPASCNSLKLPDTFSQP